MKETKDIQASIDDIKTCQFCKGKKKVLSLDLADPKIPFGTVDDKFWEYCNCPECNGTGLILK